MEKVIKSLAIVALFAGAVSAETYRTHQTGNNEYTTGTDGYYGRTSRIGNHVFYSDSEGNRVLQIEKENTTHSTVTLDEDSTKSSWELLRIQRERNQRKLMEMDAPNE